MYQDFRDLEFRVAKRNGLGTGDWRPEKPTFKSNMFPRIARGKVVTTSSRRGRTAAVPTQPSSAAWRLVASGIYSIINILIYIYIYIC